MIKHVLEVVEFRLNSGTDANVFLNAAEATKSFVSSLDGFIERHTAQNEDGLWIDVVKWRDMQCAQHASAQFEAAEEVTDFMMMIEPESVKMQHFEIEATM